METTRLQTLDQAKALSDCFYATYGLTFHRKYVYDPPELLDLNRRGDFVSFVALDQGKVVGHLAIFQPFYELEEDGRPLTDPSTKEVGLSIVSPSARKHGVQAALGMTMHQWARRNGVVGAFMKCVTHHTFSQRSAFAAGGTPVALYLGGVPRWIVYERDPNDQADPISTVVFYVPVRIQAAQPIAIAPQHHWMWSSIRPTRIIRYEAARRSPPPAGPTRLRATWQGDRRIAFVHVLRVGYDLVEALDAQVRWLQGGHIEHVSVYVPADEPFVAQCAGGLAECGMFLGGWLPGLYRGQRDALVYQVLARDLLDPEQILVHSDLGRTLRDQVVSEWRMSRSRKKDKLRVA